MLKTTTAAIAIYHGHLISFTGTVGKLLALVFVCMHACMYVCMLYVYVCVCCMCVCVCVCVGSGTGISGASCGGHWQASAR